MVEAGAHSSSLAGRIFLTGEATLHKQPVVVEGRRNLHDRGKW